MDSLKIFIIDTNKTRLLFNSLALSQSNRIKVVGNAFNNIDLLANLKQVNPDIILLDNDSFAQINGLENCLNQLNFWGFYPKVLYMHEFSKTNMDSFINSDCLQSYNLSVMKLVQVLLMNSNCLNKITKQGTAA